MAVMTLSPASSVATRRSNGSLPRHTVLRALGVAA